MSTRRTLSDPAAFLGAGFPSHLGVTVPSVLTATAVTGIFTYAVPLTLAAARGNVRLRLVAISLGAGAVTGTPTVNVMRNGVQVGTASITAAGAVSSPIVDASGKPVAFYAGDILRVDIPSAAMTATNMTVALLVETYGVP